ncbi:CDP-alcohol phosphatidyltransferase family protein [Mesorhizobium sp. M1005]|uniref:CDP-alcohol phosphatidyltransferase family protein n=1 Tax=unclassified Mesorhizobium TaxID=325217 RepID=UPI00333CF064
MLRYLIDPANAITTSGIIFSGLALRELLVGQPELAVAISLWSMLADQLDGVIAGRTKNRSPEAAKIGKSLDGFSDLIYGSVIPAAVVMSLGGGELTSIIVGIVLLVAGALRLSYFSNFGLTTGYFTGVPLSYDGPLLATLLILRPWIPDGIFVPIVTASFLLLGCLHVSPLRVPAPGGAMYLVIVAFGTTASAFLAGRVLIWT